MRPTRLAAPQSAATDAGGRGAGGVSANPIKCTTVKAMRETCPGYAWRKSCAANADSCEGSSKAPVTRCMPIVRLAAAASRSASCSLRGAARARSARIKIGNSLWWNRQTVRDRQQQQPSAERAWRLRPQVCKFLVVRWRITGTA
eukprot:scaffold15945_cov72-Phaeocystis_antarctica.AAC.2